MDMRLTFNEVAEEYERMRPHYLPQLFDDALAYSGLSDGHSALEIGIGTGQATLPFLQTGCRLTAVELGDNMAAFCRAKFADYPNFQVVVGEFETADLGDACYDFVYSAGAFQWLEQDTGYRKIHRLLGSGGTVALIWHRPEPLPEYAHVRRAIDRVYDKYDHLFREIPEQHTASNIQDTLEKLGEYGFADIALHTYRQAHHYSAAEYVALTNTNCINIALTDDTRAAFAEDLYDAIEKNGGRYGQGDPMDLYLAKKP